jgi:hypothetical protein
VCRETTEPRAKRLTFNIHREWTDTIGRKRTDIVREIKVCKECKDDLDSGISLKLLMEEMAVERRILATTDGGSRSGGSWDEAQPLPVTEVKKGNPNKHMKKLPVGKELIMESPADLLSLFGNSRQKKPAKPMKRKDKRDSKQSKKDK